LRGSKPRQFHWHLLAGGLLVLTSGMDVQDDSDALHVAVLQHKGNDHNELESTEDRRSGSGR
jgi:hypothetical protein